jgi:hypothetical protein
MPTHEMQHPSLIGLDVVWQKIMEDGEFCTQKPRTWDIFVFFIRELFGALIFDDFSKKKD